MRNPIIGIIHSPRYIKIDFEMKNTSFSLDASGCPRDTLYMQSKYKIHNIHVSLTCMVLGTCSLAKPTIACIGMLAMMLRSGVEVSPFTESTSWADISSGGPGSEIESRGENKARKIQFSG